MAIFGSSWFEDSEDIGPFSHWLEDSEDDHPIGRPIHEDEAEAESHSIKFSKECKKLDIFIGRLQKIGIKIELVGNYPWIYLDKINSNKVKERFEGEYGFTIGFLPIRPDRPFHFTDLTEIFKIIRKYNGL